MARLCAALAAVIALGGIAGLAWSREEAVGDPRLVRIGNFISPVYVAAPPGDRSRLFVVEQPGRIRVVRSGVRLARPFLDIRSQVSFGGERGLLSMAFPPDYAATGRFYVYYTARNGALTLAEFRRSTADRANPGSARVLLAIPHPRGNHNGGQLQFGPDGHLWIGTGDGGGTGDPDLNGQNLGALLGKILRIDPRPTGGAQYGIPTDNPFVGRAGARPEIWAYGLRNPWRFSFDRETGDLVIGDVGQGAWEEIDFAPAPGRGRGANYGWGCWEGRHVFERNSGAAQCSPPPSHVPPVHEYSHDTRGCSITGGYVVRDPTVPALDGRYVYGDYCRSPLWSLRLGSPAAQDDRRLGLSVAGLTSFGEDACGHVYVISGDGPVFRLQAEGGGASACAAAPRPSCRVPRVVGLRLAKARTRIRRARCRLGRVRYASSRRVRGIVVKQTPRPGVRRPAGTRVSVTLSRGRR